MLRDISHHIEILNKYCDVESHVFTQAKEACFEVALAVLAFVFAIVKFIREEGEYPTYGQCFWSSFLDHAYKSADDAARTGLESQFKLVLSDVDDALSRLGRLSKIQVRSDDGDRSDLELLQSQFAASKLSTQSSTEHAKLPCFVFPTARTVRFFDRTDVSQQIDEWFANEYQDSDRSFRSLALYGLGGVGKSCVALKYAEARRRRGDLDAMFWISSEKEVSMRQSFTEVAMRLQLSGARPKDDDENRTLVLNWLRVTSEVPNHI
jgi:hypothetical protein